MKKYMKALLLFFAFTIIIILTNNMELFKNLILGYNGKFVLINYNTIILLLLFLTMLLLKETEKINKKFFYISSFLLITFNTIIHITPSLNIIGFLLLYLFILLLTYSTMIVAKYNFEISITISVSTLILLFITIGLLNLLKFSILLITILTILSFIIILKNKKTLIKINKKFFNKGLIIFSLLFLVAIVGGMGRYVHKWDEYSYWGYAAKVLIKSNDLKSIITYLGSIGNYPPVSSIWHYIVNLFTGYSEQNLYIGLSFITYIYMLPAFMLAYEKKTLSIFLLVITCCSFPLIFNGSITYSLIYVDLFLGILCANVLILNSYLTNNNNKYILLLPLSIITLLKANGFIFACCLLLLFYLQNVLKNNFSLKKALIQLKKYILPGLLVIAIFFGWRFYANIVSKQSVSYNAIILPNSLKSDIIPKLNKEFLLNFIDSLKNSFDEPVLFTFINVPLFIYLLVIFVLIYYSNDDTKKSFKSTIVPYIIMYSIFFLLTAISLFVMFSYYEASVLASFSRYLAPINIALIIFILYQLSSTHKEKLLIYICIGCLGLTGFSSSTYFLTDIKERVETKQISHERINSFADIINNTPSNSKIFVINQQDKDSIMPMWYARYYCYPRIINSSSMAITWKIKTESNEWDLQDWGLTPDEFGEHLIEHNFDYVFFYTMTDELYKDLEDYFIDKDKYKENNLFKIIVIKDKVQLLPINRVNVVTNQLS